ncbi:DUF3592 domain-containing protein [Deinococcus yavapaiensis]|uniref:Uncharacterized protein DUF3592 n=1 Tax=Deinococcus yavapaiensis KR-236 TaxID=694435 RepID=A0A318SKW3_9DEIO|nr:DUF3592 domain-containing protein [Deinococcus yavapaiensis]PYE53165.1 uncharacterized protein DUF3592 [Deinococcus yavapaiensis KR-236]
MMKSVFASWPLERFVGLGLLVVALIFTLLLGALTQRGLRSLAWPTTSGTVTDSRVAWSLSDGKTRYSARVEYVYTVAGRTYRSSQRTYRSSESSEAYARDIVARLPKGRRVSVHFDPAAPARAVLEPGTDVFVLGALAVSVVVLLIGAGVFVRTVAPVSTWLERRRRLTVPSVKAARASKGARHP